ncbi:MAG: hypothetical protein HQL99_02730 [Magnetococcales bacterium]|nr:hypothetical protein [Magnetococcales bacterium]
MNNIYKSNNNKVPTDFATEGALKDAGFEPIQSSEDWPRIARTKQALLKKWTNSIGFPTCIKNVIEKSVLNNYQYHSAVVKYKIGLGSEGTQPEVDLLVLANKKNSTKESIVIVVVLDDGKDMEIVQDWLSKQNDNQNNESRTDRLEKLYESLDQKIVDKNDQSIRYLLLHRTASALIEAERFEASSAVVLIHSFSQSNKHFEDFNTFLDPFNKQTNNVVYVGKRKDIDLYLAWVTEEPEFL